MTKTINIDLKEVCEVKDVAELIKDMDEREQAELIYRLAHTYYNNSGRFCTQLSYIYDSIKRDYSHDTQNVIKRMIGELYDYLGN